MRIKLLSLFLILLWPICATAQVFPNRNLYDVWLTAEKYLDQGKFAEAAKLYESAPTVAEFSNRLLTTRKLTAIYQSAERQYRARNYAQALQIYSQYRSVDPGLNVAILDERIQACLRQLDKVLVRKLDQSTRVVAGFEYAYEGGQHLAVLDTVAARKDFAKARQLGGSLNATLRKQYQEGLRVTDALGNWGQRYRAAKKSESPERILQALKAYRSTSKYIVESLEYEIKSAEEGERAVLERSSNVDPGGRMVKYAEECRIEDLYFFVEKNHLVIRESGLLIGALSRFRELNDRITAFEKSPGNEGLLESAYTELVDLAREVPQVGQSLVVCAKKRTYPFLIAQAASLEKIGDDNADKTRYAEALRYVVLARGLGLTQYESGLDELQNRLSTQLGCVAAQQGFLGMVPGIRAAIGDCEVSEAWRLWQQATQALAGCGQANPDFFAPYLSLRDSVEAYHNSDRVYSDLLKKGVAALAARNCREARQFFEQMEGLIFCDPRQRDSTLLAVSPLLAECERVDCYITSRNEGLQFAQNREWKNAYDAYEKAEACATEPQKKRIKQIMSDMLCDAYPDRCRRGNVAISFEPTFRVAANRPKYIEYGVEKNTASGVLASGGVQVSFLSYLNPLDVVIGLEYFQTTYQARGTDMGSDLLAGDFSITGADAYLAFKLHQPNTDPDRLRPYLKGGLELLMPLSYSLQNHYRNENTTDRGLLKRQSLGAIGGVGVELHRRRFGFFAEITAGYNFSGIYNANAISQSGSKGKTEANFRTIGVRVGFRVW